MQSRNVDQATDAVVPPEAVIQSDLTIIGDLLTDGHIEVDGRVIGNVNGRSVTVAEHGQVEGSILAEFITVLGAVAGPIQANHVKIGNSARVIGNIFHNELTVEPGAYHEGRRPWRLQIERKPIFEIPIGDKETTFDDVEKGLRRPQRERRAPRGSRQRGRPPAAGKLV